MSAGKGDSPWRVNGEVYRENFDFIDWRKTGKCHAKAQSRKGNTGSPPSDLCALASLREPSHLEFMRSMGFDCANEADAYELRGLLDM